jgi:hypothetical protein
MAQREVKCVLEVYVCVYVLRNALFIQIYVTVSARIPRISSFEPPSALHVQSLLRI